MNRQTRYSLRASFVDCREDGQILNSRESDLPKKESQTMPDVVELTRIMMGTIIVENARNMTAGELETCYKITNKFISLTDRLKEYHYVGSLKV